MATLYKNTFVQAKDENGEPLFTPDGAPQLIQVNVPISAEDKAQNKLDQAAAKKILRRQIVRDIKAQAEEKINRIAPLHAQVNALRGPLGASDPIFAKIDAIRARSNEMETNLEAVDDDDLPSVDLPGSWGNDA